MNEAVKELWELLVGGNPDSPVCGIGVGKDSIHIYLAEKEGLAFLKKMGIGYTYKEFPVQIFITGRMRLL